MTLQIIKNTYFRMKILIIGSHGFIGSHAVNFFRTSGHQVWGCGLAESFNEVNYFQVDRYFPDYKNIFKLQKFDVCINASGAPGVSFSIEYPHDDFRMNVSNVYALLNAIRLYNPNCKFINLSSAAVYGNPQQLPIKEVSALQPVSPYGYHKMMAEYLVEEFHHIFELKTCSFRIFSAYGPGLKKQLFWDLYHKAIVSVNKEIVLFGTGEETRDFIFIEDVLIAVSKVLSQGKFNGEVFNLASGNAKTIKEAATTLLHELDPTIKLQFNNQQKPGDPLHLEADISALENLQFKTNTSLKDGLKKYLEWIRKEKE